MFFFHEAAAFTVLVPAVVEPVVAAVAVLAFQHNPETVDIVVGGCSVCSSRPPPSSHNSLVVVYTSFVNRIGRLAADAADDAAVDVANLGGSESLYSSPAVA